MWNRSALLDQQADLFLGTSRAVEDIWLHPISAKLMNDPLILRALHLDCHAFVTDQLLVLLVYTSNLYTVHIHVHLYISRTVQLQRSFAY